jgi:hypothetical protein
MSTERNRQPVTLSIDAELYKQMKLQAVMEDRDVSTITEKLYREYLRKHLYRQALTEQALKEEKAKKHK